MGAIRKSHDQKYVRHLAAPPLWPEGLLPLPAEQVPGQVLENAGARPWDRDEVDRRIVREVREKTGRIIDSQEQVGGYPAPSPTTRKLDVPQQGIDEWLQGFLNAS